MYSAVAQDAKMKVFVNNAYDVLRSRVVFEKVEILFLLAAALGCLVTLVGAVLAVPLPYALDFAEGPLLGGSVRVAHGLSPYPPATELPYVINPYGPLPYYIAGLCVKLFGVSFTAPRILVIISGIWCAALIALLVHHWGGEPHVSLGFGLLYLSRQVMTDWLPLFRVDLIGLALSLTGLYLFAKPRRWYLSIPFFVAALFCKFLLLSAPLACFLYSVFRKETRKASWFAASSLALGGMAFLWVQRETHGWFAFDTVWTQALHPYSLRDALNRAHGELITNYFLVVLALALVYYLRSRPELSLPFIYLGLSFLTLLARGKLGAFTNYSLEWTAALCCCAGLAYSSLRTPSAIRNFVSTLMPGALALMVVVNLHRPDPDKGHTECRQAYQYVKDYPGRRILSENPGALVIAGKPSVVMEPFLWTQLIVHGGWPDTEIVDLIRSRQIDLVVLGSNVKDLSNRSVQDRWPKSVADAVEQNYRLVHTFNCTDANFVYLPETAPTVR
jgi:hypothetical protein